MNYHYADPANQVVGPITEQDLHSLYRSGVITADTHVCPEGASEWRPYGSIAPLNAPPANALMSALHGVQVPQPHSNPAPVAAATQQCPFCAEDVSINAKKCKHCGETIDVALRAAEEAKRASSNQPMVFMNAGGGSSAAANQTRTPVVIVGNRKSGIIAALLNLLIPGLGYMYCGRTLLGCFVIVFAVALTVATAGIALIFLYPILIIDGFLAAGRANRKMIAIAG